MRLEKEQDLLRHLKEDACLPVYLLYGQQSYLVRLYAKKLREKAVPPSLMDLNFTYFEASRTGVDEVSRLHWKAFPFRRHPLVCS